ncbi:MAG: TolC family protein, partial [Pseudomonadota bacterium]
MTSNQQATVPARPRRWTIPALMASVAVLGGCASFSTDGGFGSVRQAAETQTGASLVWARSDAERDESSRRVAELLQREVGVDDAVQIALLNNRGLQAAFFELGISEADLVQAGRLPNPGFTFGRLARGDEIEWERGLHLNLARLLAMPLKKRIEQARFEQVKLRVTLEMLSLASETRKAWYRSVAAEETVRYMHQVQRAAEASAELARRMEQTGNWNKLMRAREQGFYADAALNVARAEQAR